MAHVAMLSEATPYILLDLVLLGGSWELFIAQTSTVKGTRRGPSAASTHDEVRQSPRLVTPPQAAAQQRKVAIVETLL